MWLGLATRLALLRPRRRFALVTAGYPKSLAVTCLRDGCFLYTQEPPGRLLDLCFCMLPACSEIVPNSGHMPLAGWMRQDMFRLPSRPGVVD